MELLLIKSNIILIKILLINLILLNKKILAILKINNKIIILWKQREIYQIIISNKKINNYN
jgi:hypothetical protein